jgi:hypothetical protein
MEDYIQERTHKTPSIRAYANGEITIEGVAIPESVLEDFKDFTIWFEKYASNPAKKTVVNIRLDYFNTSSSAYLLKIFKNLYVLKTKGNNIVVNWYHEEDDLEIKESGHDYATIVDVELNVLSYTK